MDHLINAYPEFTMIGDLPIEDGTNEDKVTLALYAMIVTCNHLSMS